VVQASHRHHSYGILRSLAGADPGCGRVKRKRKEKEKHTCSFLDRARHCGPGRDRVREDAQKKKKKPLSVPFPRATGEEIGGAGIFIIGESEAGDLAF
jgi:hypothetical protein